MQQVILTNLYLHVKQQGSAEKRHWWLQKGSDVSKINHENGISSHVFSFLKKQQGSRRG